MKDHERRDIEAQLRVYDQERERGLVHTASYDIKMEQYRLMLNSPRSKDA